MSLPFNDTTTRKGIVQLYEKEIGANFGDISGNTNRLKDLTADVNMAIDSYLRLAFPKDGRWKLDDSNHADLPEIYTDLLTTTNRYTFTEDETGNLLLDIYKVYVLDNGEYRALEPVDPDSDNSQTEFQTATVATGMPTKYDKTANIIVLDKKPAVQITNGLKASINREASYFTHTDTTKKVGFPGTHHAYFYLLPALDYARRNTLTSYPRIEGAVMKLEREISETYNRRARDERPMLTINRESTR